MSEPTVKCLTCGQVVPVTYTHGGEYPPDVAKRKLAKVCRESLVPHESKPEYRAGVQL